MGEREIRGYPAGTDLPKGNTEWKNLKLYRDHALSIFVVHSKGFINAWMNSYSGPKCVFLFSWLSGNFFKFITLDIIKLLLIVKKLTLFCEIRLCKNSKLIDLTSFKPNLTLLILRDYFHFQIFIKDSLANKLECWLDYSVFPLSSFPQCFCYAQTFKVTHEICA